LGGGRRLLIFLATAFRAIARAYAYCKLADIRGLLEDRALILFSEISYLMACQMRKKKPATAGGLDRDLTGAASGDAIQRDDLGHGSQAFNFTARVDSGEMEPQNVRQTLLCHPRESGDPVISGAAEYWIPAFAGMTPQ
jgi:hypothetical protein